MRTWKYKIDVKKHFVDKDNTAQEASKGVLQELKKLERWQVLKEDDEFQRIQEEFDRLGDDPEARTAEFDEVLSRLYDWADANDVWLGL